LIALGDKVAPEVQPLLSSEDRAVRAEAANILRAIGAMDAAAIVTIALADLNDHDNGVRVRALKDLARAQPAADDPRRADVANTLLGLTKDSQLSIRVEATRALAPWVTTANVPALLDLLASDSGDTRHAAMDALGRLGDKRAVTPVAQHLVGGDDRSAATRSLQAMGAVCEAEVLRYLQHRDAAVRVAACRILQVVGTRNSVQHLRNSATERNRDVSRAAQEALDAIARRRSTKTAR
jgi:HEAT repeat protein